MKKFKVTLLKFYCSDEIDADNEQEALNEVREICYYDANEPHHVLAEEMESSTKTILQVSMSHGDAVIKEVPNEICREIEEDFRDDFTEELVNKWREKLAEYPVIASLPTADYDFIY